MRNRSGRPPVSSWTVGQLLHGLDYSLQGARKTVEGGQHPDRDAQFGYINDLAQRVDGTPSGVAGSVYVKLLAQPNIPEGVLLPAKAQVVKCATPGCPIWFIKLHPRQKYHDESCRS